VAIEGVFETLNRAHGRRPSGRGCAQRSNEARLRYANVVTSYNQSQVNMLAALGLIDSGSLAPADRASQTPTIQPAAN
jgi:hypothetical protein